MAEIGTVSYTHLGDFGFKIDDSRMHGENKILAETVNSIGDGIQEAVATSMKDEKLKADPVSYTHLDVYKRQIPSSLAPGKGKSFMRLL